jgi:predicted alpha/beta-hydrolase family hydrolase
MDPIPPRPHGPDRLPVLQEAFRDQVRQEWRAHQEQRRNGHLAALRSPTLILQGERDSFGRREEVESYALSPQAQLVWIPAGDHSFRPTRSSGRSEAENLAAAGASSDRFLREVLA